ncbi:putative LRR receptor-like serine/threonine-protein kinase [Capsicum chinense]|nr:putative LRR receptor-like serine/threonine-protein kinase [Capsicum chinense]
MVHFTYIKLKVSNGRALLDLDRSNSTRDNSPSTSVLRMNTCFSQHIKVSDTFLGIVLEMPFSLKTILQSCWVYLQCRNTWLTVSKVSPHRKYQEHKFSLGQRADASTDWREFTSPEGRKYYYNEVTRTSKWRKPDEVKVMLDLNPIWLAREKDTISHASDFGSIFVVKTSSPRADESSSLSGKVSSPMIETVEMKNSSKPASPAVANLEKIGIAVTLGNSVAPPVSETTTAQDAVVYGDGFSSENRENVKKDAAITEIGGATPSDEKTVELGPLVYESKAAKSAFKTLLESVNIGSDCMWDQAMRAVINDRRYGALKSLGERKQAFNEYLSQKKKLEAEERRVKQKKAREDFRIIKAISIFEHDERFKDVERDKDCEDLFEDYVEELEKNVKLLLLNFLEHAKALEEQKRNRVEYLEFLKSCDFIKASSQWQKVQDCLETDERCSRLEKIDRLEIFQEYIRYLESEDEEQRKLRMEELRKAERKNRDEVRKLMEEHVAAGILNAKTNWRDYCISVSFSFLCSIKEFAAYLVVSSNTSGSPTKDLFTDVMDELEKQWLLAVVLVVIDELVGSRNRPVAVGGGGVGSRGVHGLIWVVHDDGFENTLFTITFASTEEATALLKWKTTFKNQNNSLLASWKPSSDACNGWYGVICFIGRVNRLNIKNSRVIGTLYDFPFSSLRFLEYFELSMNNLSGTIPPEISNLTSLIYLDLSINQISGTIPPEISLLTRLQTLHIFANHLNGSIPEEIGYLRSLT